MVEKVAGWRTADGQIYASRDEALRAEGVAGLKALIYKALGKPEPIIGVDLCAEYLWDHRDELQALIDGKAGEAG